MSKKKGTHFENEIVDAIRERGWEAIRAPESDGRHLGETAGTDILMFANDGEMVTVQCARRKKIASYLTEKSDDVDVLMLRENYGNTLAILPAERFYDILDLSKRGERSAATLDKIIELLTQLRNTYANRES
jgi:Holliday junction resolvase